MSITQCWSTFFAHRRPWLPCPVCLPFKHSGEDEDGAQGRRQGNVPPHQASKPLGNVREGLGWRPCLTKQQAVGYQVSVQGAAMLLSGFWNKTHFSLDWRDADGWSTSVSAVHADGLAFGLSCCIPSPRTFEHGDAGGLLHAKAGP